MKANVASKNAYEILGVPRTADVAQIRKAFRALAIQHHPDARPPDEKKAAAETFARINQAHEVLRDSEKRKKYDGLLDRGQTPDLGQDLAEQGRFASLADIVGEVKSLGLSDEHEKLIGTVSEDLREKMLKPMLIRGEGFSEHVADAIPISFAEKGDGLFEKLSSSEREALGGCTAAFLVVTELRLILLITYTLSWQEGNTQYTRTSYRSYAIPYGGLDELLFHEVGRNTRAYRIELKTSEGLRFEMSPGSGAEGSAYANSRLSRLFLVANLHKIPLKMVSSGSAGSEYGEATAIGCIPIILWILPFIIAGICAVCQDSDKNKQDCEKHWPGLLAFMNDWFITTIAIYSVPVLIAWMMLDVYSKWRLRRPEHVFGGDLAFDFAAAPPAIGEAVETPAPAAAPSQPSSRAPAQKTGPIKPPPKAPAVPTPAATTPAEAAPPRPAPAAVALPDSILEAFGDDSEPALPPPPPPPPPPAPTPTPPPVAPPRPAASTSVPSAALIPCPNCGHPNRPKAQGASCEECGAPLGA